MILLSFDIGIKNLAYCMLDSDDGSILDWNLIDCSGTNETLRVIEELDQLEHLREADLGGGAGGKGADGSAAAGGRRGTTAAGPGSDGSSPMLPGAAGGSGLGAVEEDAFGEGALDQGMSDHVPHPPQDARDQVGQRQRRAHKHRKNMFVDSLNGPKNIPGRVTHGCV